MSYLNGPVVFPTFFNKSEFGNKVNLNGKQLQYSCLENPMISMKRQNVRILKEELPRSVGAQYATGDQQRNNFKKNEGMERKQKNTQLWM